MEGSITNTCTLNELIVLPAISYGHHFVNCPLLNLLEKRKMRGKEDDKEEGAGVRNKRKVNLDCKTACE